jgi:hypothetical protein
MTVSYGKPFIAHEWHEMDPARHGMPAWQSGPHGTESRTTQYPERQSIPDGVLTHPTQYPAQHGISNGIIGHSTPLHCAHPMEYLQRLALVRQYAEHAPEHRDTERPHIAGARLQSKTSLGRCR